MQGMEGLGGKIKEFLAMLSCWWQWKQLEMQNLMVEQFGSGIVTLRVISIEVVRKVVESEEVTQGRGVERKRTSGA